MWAATAATRPGASISNWLWAARHRSWDLPVMTTLAPAARCPWARAKPIPRVPPVMIAVLPVRSNSLRSFSAFITCLFGRLVWRAHGVGESLPGGGEELGRREDLSAVLQRDRGRHVGGILVGPEHLLCHLQSKGAVRQENIGDLVGASQEFFVVHHFGHQPDALGFVGTEPARGENQLGCTCGADEFRQGVADSDVTARNAELDE